MIHADTYIHVNKTDKSQNYTYKQCLLSYVFWQNGFIVNEFLYLC